MAVAAVGGGGGVELADLEMLVDVAPNNHVKHIMMVPEDGLTRWL